MTRFIAPGCGCVIDTAMGQKKPEVCEEHRTRMVRASSLRVVEGREKKLDNDKRRRRPSECRRDWSLANAKREEEEDLCRVTKEPGTELAHVLGRKYDEPISPNSRTLLVLPDRVVPLAPRIHTAYDHHEFDLLPYLTTAEQAQAVLDAGSIGQALKRISPEAARELAA